MKIRFLKQAISILLLNSIFGEALYACSGQGIDKIIAHNWRVVLIYGLIALGFVFLVIAVYFARQRRGLYAILVSLITIFFHPMWHYDDGGGDCGQTMVQMAGYITLIILMVLILQIILWRYRKPKESQIST